MPHLGTPIPPRCVEATPAGKLPNFRARDDTRDGGLLCGYGRMAAWPLEKRAHKTYAREYKLKRRTYCSSYPREGGSLIKLLPGLSKCSRKPTGTSSVD